MSNRGYFSNTRHFPLKIDNMIEINGHLIFMMLVPSEEIIKVVVDAANSPKDSISVLEYDINNPEEVMNAFVDFASYVKAARLAGKETTTSEEAKLNG
jgi:hypothetical protein